MPASFIVLALAMCAIAALFVILPAWRSGRESGQSWVLASSLFAVILIAGSAAFYNQTSSWNWSSDGVPDSPLARQLYELQRAVHDDEHNAAAWARLGRFYLQFERQLPAAIDALEKSVTLSGGRDVEINLNLVEALAMRGAPNDRTRSADILNATLQLDPQHRKALWYGGEVAASLGQWEVAIARWQVMLDDSRRLGTPEALRVTRLLEDRIATARRHGQTASSQPKNEAHGSTPEAVRVRVSLQEELAQTSALTPATNVFVFVRAAGQGGPPLAVHRATVGQLPLDVVMSDADAMMPGRTLSAFDELDIVARVSLGGTPTQMPGDLYGEQAIGGDDARDVSIVINQVVATP